MGKGNTPAVTFLTRAKVAFEAHEYGEVDAGDSSYGEAVAATLGVAPERLFKTLLAVVDAEPAVAIVPTSGQLSLKALAKAAP